VKGRKRGKKKWSGGRNQQKDGKTRANMVGADKKRQKTLKKEEVDEK